MEEVYFSSEGQVDNNNKVYIFRNIRLKDDLRNDWTVRDSPLRLDPIKSERWEYRSTAQEKVRKWQKFYPHLP